MDKNDTKTICDALGALRGFIEALRKDNLTDMQNFKDMLSTSLQGKINERNSARKVIPSGNRG